MDVQTSGQHPMDLVVCDVGGFRDMGNILWIWLSVMWGCPTSGQHPMDLVVSDVGMSNIWATSCGSGGQ